MRAHLDACSVLRSSSVPRESLPLVATRLRPKDGSASAYRKYASSLRPCARADLHPPPAIAPSHPQILGRILASLVSRGFLTPTPNYAGRRGIPAMARR